MKKSPFQTTVSKLYGLSPLKNDVDEDKDAESGQSWLASATETFRENLAKNLNPYSYSDPIGRIYKAGIKGEKEETFEEEIWKKMKPGDPNFGGERIDLLNIVMGQPQKYNSMKESEYKPTKSKNPNATYYRSAETENEIKDTITSLSHQSNIQGFSGAVEELTSRQVGTKGDIGHNIGWVLGEYKIDKGVDKKGHYISYYDVWDLNPIPEIGVDAIDIGVGKVASYLTKKAGLKSPEIYGRIYYDPKTGEFLD